MLPFLNNSAGKGWVRVPNAAGPSYKSQCTVAASILLTRPTTGADKEIVVLDGRIVTLNLLDGNLKPLLDRVLRTDRKG